MPEELNSSTYKEKATRGLHTAVIVAILIAALSILVSVLSVAISLTRSEAPSALEKRISELESKNSYLSERVSSLEKGKVDLTASTFQDVASDFAILVKTVEPYLAGVRIKGLILNQKSVEARDVTFNVSLEVGKDLIVLSEVKTLVVPQIRPGRAASFEVYIADVKATQPMSANFLFDHANLSYLLE